MTARNVLFVSTVGELGGGESCMLRIMVQLDRPRFAAALACPPGSPLATAAGEAGLPVFALHGPASFDEDAAFDLSESLRLPGARPGWRRRPRTLLNYARVLPAALSLARTIASQDVAIVHANSPRAAMVGGLAGRRARRVVVTHVRDIVHTPFAKPLPARALTLLSDVFMAASEATRAVIASPRPAHVVYDGLPAPLLEAAPGPVRADVAAPQVGMVAQLSPWKGHDQLVRAARIVLGRHPRATFTLCGSDWGMPAMVAYRRKVEGLIAELGLGDRVVLAGSRSDIPTWLAGLDVFVHPPTAPDPFPGALLEACASGRPIVATRTGGIPEAVEHGVSALLVPPGDPAALAQAIVDLLDDRRRAAALGREARRAAERFTMARTVEEVEDVYERALGGAGSAR
jgi:glycosyltransferase involved in cell wall biosynthesis